MSSNPNAVRIVPGRGKVPPGEQVPIRPSDSAQWMDEEPQGYEDGPLFPDEPVAEAFNASELRNFLGRWTAGGGTRSHTTALLLSPTGDAGKVSAPIRPLAARVRGAPSAPKSPHSPHWQRYEGGQTVRMSSPTRESLRSAFTPKERATRQAPQPSKDLGTLYQTAAVRQEDFKRVLDMGAGVAKRLGARIQNTGTKAELAKAIRDVAAHPNKPHVIIAALKGRDRAESKVAKKYGGDASRITDLSRATIVVPHADNLPGAIKALRAELPAGWKISEPVNRFVPKEKGDLTNTGAQNGYRDISVLLVAPDGFHMECQINTAAMWLAKEAGPGHEMYEESRATREAAQHEMRDLTPQEAKRLRYLDRKSRELYDAALRDSVRTTRAVQRTR